MKTVHLNYFKTCFLFSSLALLVSWMPSQAQNTISSQTALNQACSQIMNGRTTVFYGDFIISGTSVNDLSPMSNATEITGDLIVQSTGLYSLDGLQNLQKVGGAITFTNNPILRSEAYCAIAGALRNHDPSKVTLSSSMYARGTTGLVQAIQRGIYYPNISYQGGAYSPLISMVAGGCYTTLQGDVTISGNSVTDLSLLAGIEKIMGTLTISKTSLTDLSALSSLTSVGGLEITDNAKLVSLNGLENCQNFGTGNLIIENNPLLNDCLSICTLVNRIEDSNDVLVERNGGGCEGLAQCSQETIESTNR